METQEQMYSAGFNHGYLLEKYMPELVAKLMKTITPQNNYVEGFISGKEEYDFEYAKLQTNELSKIRNKSIDRDKGIDDR